MMLEHIWIHPKPLNYTQDMGELYGMEILPNKAV